MQNFLSIRHPEIMTEYRFGLPRDFPIISRLEVPSSGWYGPFKGNGVKIEESLAGRGFPSGGFSLQPLC